MKKTYFASDFHLGVDARLTSLERERQICRWLDVIAEDAEAIYLVGDIFDYWFEYKMVIPKGFTRLLGKLATLRDNGIEIYFFTGNHDMWMFRYLTDEMDIPIYREPIVKYINGKKFFIAHGDGIGAGDYGYKVMKKIFNNRICQWLFSQIHPSIGLGLMRFFSRKSKESHVEVVENTFYGETGEWFIAFVNERLKVESDIDFFIFGHRHLAIDWTLHNGHSRYINLGEWLNLNTYAVFDGEQLSLQTFENHDITIYENK